VSGNVFEPVKASVVLVFAYSDLVDLLNESAAAAGATVSDPLLTVSLYSSEHWKTSFRQICERIVEDLPTSLALAKHSLYWLLCEKVPAFSSSLKELWHSLWHRLVIRA